VCQENWTSTLVTDEEPDLSIRWIIQILKEKQQAMNHKDGSYRLSHVYVCLPGTAVTYLLCQEPEEELTVSSNEGL